MNRNVTIAVFIFKVEKMLMYFIHIYASITIENLIVHLSSTFHNYQALTMLIIGLLNDRIPLLSKDNITLSLSFISRMLDCWLRQSAVFSNFVIVIILLLSTTKAGE